MVPQDAPYNWSYSPDPTLDAFELSDHSSTLIQSLLTKSGLTLSSLPVSDAVEAIERCMVGHFRRTIPDTQNIPSLSLDLAIAVFQNIEGMFSRPRLGLPYVECLRTTSLLPVSPRYIAGNDASPFDPCPIFGDYWMFDTISSAVTAQIVTACGLDPTTCTHTTLEDRDPYIVCLTCAKANPSDKFRPTMRWSQGVSFKLKRVSVTLTNPRSPSAFSLASGA